MSYNIGAICGYIGLGFFADRFGRKPIVMIFFAASLVLTFALYRWTTDLHLLLLVAAVNGFFTLGQYSWMSVWLPELYPTRMRATGMAFTFNSPRFIAFLGPLFAGMLIALDSGLTSTMMIIGLKAFPAALVGGLDSLVGALVGALIIGAAEVLSIQYIDPLLSDVVPFLVLIAMLVVRPWGLFGTREELDRV